MNWFDMNVNPWLWTLANVELFMVSLVMFTFVALYFWVSKWYEREAGRSILAVTASWLLLLLLVDIGILTTPTPFWIYPADTIFWRPALRAVIATVTLLSSSNLLYTLLSHYRRRESFTAEVDIRTHPRFGRKSKR